MNKIPTYPALYDKERVYRVEHLKEILKKAKTDVLFIDKTKLDFT